MKSIESFKTFENNNSNNPNSRVRTLFFNRCRRHYFQTKEDIIEYLLPLEDQKLECTLTPDYDDESTLERFLLTIKIEPRFAGSGPIYWHNVREDILQLLSYLDYELFILCEMSYTQRLWNTGGVRLVELKNVGDVEKIGKDDKDDIMIKDIVMEFEITNDIDLHY